MTLAGMKGTGANQQTFLAFILQELAAEDSSILSLHDRLDSVPQAARVQVQPSIYQPALAISCRPYDDARSHSPLNTAG